MVFFVRINEFRINLIVTKQNEYNLDHFILVIIYLNIIRGSKIEKDKFSINIKINKYNDNDATKCRMTLHTNDNIYIERGCKLKARYILENFFSKFHILLEKFAI